MHKNVPRIESNTFYHVYNRGNNKQNIFFENENYYYFLRLWKKHITPIAETYAYCLLTNHFHFLVKIKNIEEESTGNSRMNKVEQHFANFFNAYTKSINKKYERTGKLFHHRFRRKSVEDERYLQQLIYYIHSNPQGHGIVEDFRDYGQSSYHSFLSTGKTESKREEVLKQFGSKELFIEYHNSLHIELKQLEKLEFENEE